MSKLQRTICGPLLPRGKDCGIISNDLATAIESLGHALMNGIGGALNIVSVYELAEQAAQRVLPNRVIEGFSPILFDAVGYPSRVKHLVELHRYVDVMHEMRFDQDFKSVALGFTQQEWDVYRDIAARVADLSQSQFGRRIVPKGALLKAMLVMRHISMVYPDQRPVVVELGSGSGYLPAILAREGFPVVTMDNAQAFYLWQHVFWRSFFGERLIETAFDESDFAALETVPEGHIVHVPWWKFVQIDYKSLKLKAQLFTANHMLCEMHEYAFRYTIGALKCILTARNGIEPLILFAGYGSDRHRRVENTDTALEQGGYIWAVKDPMICAMTQSAAAGSRADEIKRMIDAGRASIPENISARFDDVRAYQIELAGRNGIWTDDELFIQSIYGATSSF